MRKIVLFMAWCLVAWPSLAETPLRVFIRAGEKTHGSGQHDHPQFLKDWTKLLNERGAKADGAMNFPTPEQLAASDVLVIFAAEGATITPEQRPGLEKFLQRGGGLVVLHDGICGNDPQWFKTIAGGSWEDGHSKFFEGDLAFYYQDSDSPITKGVSNFDFEDEMYWDLHLMPGAHILAATYQPDKRNTQNGRVLPSVYDIVPQMWTYEKDNYRAFVSIPGHNYKTFNLPHFRAVLLRGIAWAGKREVDSLVSKEELASLRYPEGGPTPPEKSGALIKTRPEFDLNLVAAEPLISKPISLDWDGQGRMWVAETIEYPIHTNQNVPPHDRISILEDTNGDGVMDKKTAFYNDLNLVTSMVLYKDGVIVAQAPDIYWLRDTDGDGKADKKELLYTGFGVRDTHAVINNMRWGLDGWIYATIGYSGGDVKSGDGKMAFGQMNAGVIRFKPDGTGMEQYCSKPSNTWGLDLGWDGEVFFSQANGNHIDHVVMPESVLARGKVGDATSFKVIEDHDRTFPIRDYLKQAYVQIDFVGGFTAAAGCCIYNGGAWPEKYNYTHYVAEPTVNLVHQDFIKPDGVTYIASKDREEEFIAATDLWFRPVHQRIGPDGALYILDFYNQAAVHNDTRGPKHGPNNAAVRPDRDHYFGRIWRVQHKEAKKFDIPKMDKNHPAELVKALEHPNEWVRMTAHRLLVENPNPDILPDLAKLLLSDKAPEARLHALWILAANRAVKPNLISAALQDSSSAIRKNALRIVSETVQPGSIPPRTLPYIQACLNESEPRVRLAALIALGYFPLEGPQVEAVLRSWPVLTDVWSKSAAIGLTSRSPFVFVDSMLNSGKPELAGFAAELAKQIANQQSADSARKIVLTVAAKPVSADALKAIFLQSFAKNLKSDIKPAWTAEIQTAFKTLLNSDNNDLVAAAMTLAGRWDSAGTLSGQMKGPMEKLLNGLNDTKQSDDQRARAGEVLLSLRSLDAGILPAVGKVLNSGSSVALQKQLIQSLGETGDAAIGPILLTAYGVANPEIQGLIFAQLIKRADSSMALLAAVENKSVKGDTLSPDAVHRLRTHSDPAVAKRANAVFDASRGPEIKEKDVIIAKLAPEVVQKGDATVGKALFTKNCAVCHTFKGEGKQTGPDLTGIGAHGPAELLVHVVDPNRVVEPNFVAISIETTDGESVDGVIASENAQSVVLRNASGQYEIPRSKITRQRNTGRSLMPEGFEALGAPALRDIFAYMCADEMKYRILDLSKVCTADGSKGRYLDPLPFKKYGIIKYEDIPFEIIPPNRTTTGRNYVILKGHFPAVQDLPHQVELDNLDLGASKLHFLAAAAWGWPWNGEGASEGMPVAKVILQFRDGATQEITLRNGLEIADYNGHHDVPESVRVPNLIDRNLQFRWFSKTVTHKGAIQKITLQSLDTVVAPAFIAITAELGEGEPPKPIEFPTEHPHVLIFGGGSSHDFTKWFNQDDSGILQESGHIPPRYTEDLDLVAPALKNADVLYLCSNKPMTDPALRQGIFDFANEGKGLLLVHPALWYNWNNWPEYNRVLVGGGAHSHDKYGEFEVTVTQPNHPIMAGVAPTFKTSDELYHVEIDPKGTPIEVLAVGKNAAGKEYPVIWITKHPTAKIVCITLGHDGATHDNAPYRKLLQNAAAWAAGK